MKIAFFLDIPQGLGGAGNALLEQARIMNKIHDVIVVIPCSRVGEINTEYERRCQKANLNYKSMYYKTAFYPQYIDIITAWEVFPNICDFIKDERIDFLHCVQLNIAVEMASRKMEIPHLMNAYSLKQEEFNLCYMDIFPQYHLSDSFVYCKVWGKNLHIETKCIRPVAPLRSIKNKRNSYKNILRILMLGSVCEYKNQLSAIQAVEHCIKMGVQVSLTITGNKESLYAQKCEQYIEQRKLSNSVRMIGFCEDVVPLLNEHDCLLCASRRESFPCSIVEAMTYGLIIVSTPVAGVPELLVDGENAYISKGYTIDKIADCINRCAEEYVSGAIQKIQKGAEKLWKNNFSEEVIQKKLDEYYLYIMRLNNTRTYNTLKKNIYVEKIYKIYEKLLKSNIEHEVVLSRCYYYAFLNLKLQYGKVYIWGAGKYGKIAKELISILFENIDIKAFVDSRKIGEYLGIPIITPEDINLNKIDYVFLGFVEGQEQAILFFGKKGF